MSEKGKQERKPRQAPERQLELDAEVLSKTQDQDQDEEDDAPTPEEVAEQHRQDIEAANAAAAREKAARIQAETAARTAQDRLRETEETAFGAQEKAIESQIESYKQLQTQARMAWRAARESGDFDGEDKANDSLMEAKAALLTLNGQKAYLESQKTQMAKAPRQEARQTEATRQSGYSEASQAWIEKHPQFNSDPHYKTMVLAAAQTAQAEGCMADSPQFFKFIEETLSRAFPTKERDDGPSPTRQSAIRKSPSAGAMGVPPSRESPPRRGNGGAPDPVAVARGMGPNVTVEDLQNFARFSKMKFEDYVAEQAQIQREQAAGMNTGLYDSEGR